MFKIASIRFLLLAVPLSSLLMGVSFSGYSQSKPHPDSVKVAIAPEYDKVSGAHRFFLGEDYRKLWATPVKFRVFHLNQEKGGLQILQRGGGMQSKSLRLKDKNGQEWVIRSVQKNPEKVLPPTLRATVAKDIVQDQISAEHPFASVTIPPMAKALGIPHANPELVYVPDDAAFGEYRKDFANQVFLFEEREPLDADKTDNTDKAQDKLQEDNDNRVDQKMVLRARLLDMLVGDWDRHEDQWRWERTKNDTGIVYEPVPRDRDQVYYDGYGVFPWLLSKHLLMAKFQSFGDKITSIGRWNRNARYFDRYFLNGLSEKDWETQIDFFRNTLTDEVIIKAIKLMPPNIYQISGESIVNRLIARRNNLKQQVLRYYRILSQTVEIPASDKNEYFNITNLPDGKLSVKINKLKKDGKQEQVIYARTFDPAVTNEIRLFAMDGKDVFAIHGETSSPIKVRMIGGGDKDTFLIDSTLTGKGRRYIYDRSDEKNVLPNKNQAHIRTSADTSVNTYVKRNFKYNYLQPLIVGSYNKDYGFQLIGDFIYQKQGFRKEPYAFRQSLLVNYGFGTNSLMLNYKGDFKQVVGKNDLIIDVLSKGPNYTSNFFGLGNESVFVNEKPFKLKYYQNIYNYQEANIRLKHDYGNWIASVGITAQYYNGDQEDNLSRFLSAYNQLHPNENVFAPTGYAGLAGTVSFDTRDKGTLPHRGIYWRTDITGMRGFGSKANNYGQATSEFTLYLNPDRDSVFVIAARFGGGTTVGNAAYYQQIKLGGNEGLRGFNFERFTGKSMAYNNIELRLKMFDFVSYVTPGTIGIIAFNDVGRVWIPGENSNKWHDGYGGGIYFIPAELILIQGVVGHSSEGTYPYISAGFRF
ncbi:MAG: BamA/TamA family outer membrane protein [Mucilaginibacter sp.]|uniref:BamA/TamA family outer membrane protein n=1 Tax=Mucilaginibacter sp. TaxID=1882438 RepID=UPI003266E40B